MRILGEMTECSITKDDLRIVLLKCVGSKYPTKIVCADRETKDAYIRGFVDADCNILAVSQDQELNEVDQLDIQLIKRVETAKIISFERSRSKVFNVDPIN